MNAVVEIDQGPEHASGAFFLPDPSKVRDLAPDVLVLPGRPRIMPASYYAATTATERAVFGVRNAIYGLPTHELVAKLAELIRGRPAIEIGAGHGALAHALGITATDSHQQADPGIRLIYAAQKQPTVVYGRKVKKLDALTAVSKLRPEVVVASWVTHAFDEAAPEREGNGWGVDEEQILRAGCTYLFVGNTRVHREKPIWRFPHRRMELPYVYSRAMNGTPDFLAVFDPLPAQVR